MGLPICPSDESVPEVTTVRYTTSLYVEESSIYRNWPGTSKIMASTVIWAVQGGSKNSEVIVLIK